MRSSRLVVTGAVLALLAASCLPPAPSVLPPNSPTLSRTVIVSGQSDVVWDIGFVPTDPQGDAFFFTFRGGAIKYKDGAGAVVTLTGGPTDVRNTGGEGGMTGLVVDPAFVTNRYIYTCYSAINGGVTDNRVVRWHVDAGFTALDSPIAIIQGMPHNDGAKGRHSGCRPRFMPGTDQLFIGTGDAATGTNPQNPGSLGGKILRVTREGAPYPGNPGFADNRIYQIGHRNVQGLAFRPGSNQPFNGEHGPDRDDEINRVLPGTNAGWDPVPLPYNEAVPMTDYNKFKGALAPTWRSGESTVAPSGMTFLSGPQWRSWNGALAVGLLKFDAATGQKIRLIFLSATGKSVVSQHDVLPNLGQRIRTLVEGPDGNLYVGTDSGQIWKVTPS